MRLVAHLASSIPHTYTTVIPAQAGIHSAFANRNAKWIPAYVYPLFGKGMTNLGALIIL